LNDVVVAARISGSASSQKHADIGVLETVGLARVSSRLSWRSSTNGHPLHA